MHLDFLLNPLTAYGLSALGLMASLALFVNIRWEIAKSLHVTGDDADGARAAGQQEVGALQEEVKTLREALSRVQQQQETLSVPRTVGQGINLNRRAQALRMNRRGETVESIAAALETPANEIALLLKVYEMTGSKKAS